VKIVFWVSVLLIVYPSAVYPLVVLAVGWVRPRPVRPGPYAPTVTVLIAAYNEAEYIGATVQNKLDQNYPKEKLQIIVVSDESSDGTDDIVRQFADRGVQLLRLEGREGKAAALNEAVRHAVGEVIVFSDANSLFDPDAIRLMVENFADDDVGYVTGSLGFLSEGVSLSGSGVNAYMRYENLLRQAETNLGSIIGVNGGVGAIRRELYVDTPPQLITDFVLSLTVMARGHRVVFDSRVRSREAANTDLTSEFRMRVRVALRALQGIAYMRRLLNPLRYPFASFSLVSHKVLRYMAFVFLVVALVCNIDLAMSMPFYRILLAMHLTGYALALIGLSTKLPPWLRRITVVPSYLLMSYSAFAIAVFKFLRGETIATWRPRAG
jgi:cellulose synthase/poly-beta-1,6-N-acetylglucosamine synthase-like glycosyltransferase